MKYSRNVFLLERVLFILLGRILKLYKESNQTFRGVCLFFIQSICSNESVKFYPRGKDNDCLWHVKNTSVSDLKNSLFTLFSEGAKIYSRPVSKNWHFLEKNTDVHIFLEFREVHIIIYAYLKSNTNRLVINRTLW